MSQVSRYQSIPDSVRTRQSGRIGKGALQNQSPRNVNFDRLTKIVKKYGFIRCQAYHTLFVKNIKVVKNKRSKEHKMTLFIVYVDDIIITKNDEGIGNFNKLPAREF